MLKHTEAPPKHKMDIQVAANWSGEGPMMFSVWALGLLSIPMRSAKTKTGRGINKKPCPFLTQI